MSKFYRVIKDHPLLDVGAILSNEKESRAYCPINDLFTKDVKDIDEDWYEMADLVENQPEWFERVYKATLATQTKYLAKDKAREIYDKLYQ
jgi:hypothetical protein